MKFLGRWKSDPCSFLEYSFPFILSFLLFLSSLSFPISSCIEYQRRDKEKYKCDEKKVSGTHSSNALSNFLEAERRHLSNLVTVTWPFLISYLSFCITPFLFTFHVCLTLHLPRGDYEKKTINARKMKIVIIKRNPVTFSCDLIISSPSSPQLSSNCFGLT